MSLREVIKNNNLNSSEVGIIESIYKHLDNDNYGVTVREIAQDSFVSTASVIRLAKKLGYMGYSDMLISLKNESSDSVEFRIRDVLSTIIIDDQSLNVIDQFIDDALSRQYYRYHFVGIGYSSISAGYLCEKFQELDFMATNKSPLDFQNTLPYVLVLISESGETSDLTFIAERCLPQDSKIYCISSRENSTLCKMLENNIVIKRPKTKNTSIAYPNFFIGNTLILMESIVSTLHNAYDERRKNND